MIHYPQMLQASIATLTLTEKLEIHANIETLKTEGTLGNCLLRRKARDLGKASGIGMGTVNLMCDYVHAMYRADFIDSGYDEIQGWETLGRLLDVIYTEDEASGWLVAPHPQLDEGDLAPLRAVKEGRISEVIEILKRLASESYL